MTSSEAARKGRMTGMPEQAAAPGGSAGAQVPAPTAGTCLWNRDFGTQENFSRSSAGDAGNYELSRSKSWWDRSRRQPWRGQAAAELGSVGLSSSLSCPTGHCPTPQVPQRLPGWSFCETRGNRNYRSPAHTITGRELILLLNEFRCYFSNFCII